MRYCYQILQFTDVPKSVQYLMYLASKEVEEHTFFLAKESNPAEANLKRDTRINGVCIYSDEEPFTVIVIKDAEQMISTFFHEFRHFKAHKKLFDQLKKAKNPDEPNFKKAFRNVIEEDAEQYADQMLTYFKAKYPDAIEKAQSDLDSWIPQHSDIVHNNRQNGLENAEDVKKELAEIGQKITTQLSEIKELIP